MAGWIQVGGRWRWKVDETRAHGTWRIEIFETPECKKLLRVVEIPDNMTTNDGLNHQIGVELAGTAQITTWYGALIANSGYSALAAGDTMASHAGWTEDQNYSESVRQTWTPGAVSGQQVTNPTAMTFTMNATTTIRGAFLTSSNTKGGTTGTLFATGLFDATQALVSGNTLKVTYTYSMTGS